MEKILLGSMLLNDKTIHLKYNFSITYESQIKYKIKSNKNPRVSKYIIGIN